jgi:hypothetical protein
MGTGEPSVRERRPLHDARGPAIRRWNGGEHEEKTALNG